MDAPLLIPVVIMGVFIFLGIILSMEKCSFLIAGYNLMSREKKNGTMNAPCAASPAS